MIRAIWLICISGLLCGQVPSRKIVEVFADRYHKHQRELEAVVEEWTAYCKSIDRVLSQNAGQSEPHCNPVPATPATKPEVK